MVHRNKSKIFEIFSLSSIIFSSLSFFGSLDNKKVNSFTYHGSSENSSKPITNSSSDNINKLISNFPWLEKYKYDEKFVYSNFNSYTHGRLIKNVLIDQYLCLTQSAFYNFYQYVLKKYSESLKFTYTCVFNNFQDVKDISDYDLNFSPTLNKQTYTITLDDNYFNQSFDEINWETFFNQQTLLFDPFQQSALTNFKKDVKAFFLDDKINGIYYIEENDKNNENNDVNHEVKNKISKLKEEMNYAKKQLHVFLHSLTCERLCSNEATNELNKYLSKIRDRIANFFNHVANNEQHFFGKSYHQKRIEDHLRKAFNKWIKSSEDIKKNFTIYKDYFLFVENLDKFFNYLVFYKDKYVQNATTF